MHEWMNGLGDVRIDDAAGRSAVAAGVAGDVALLGLGIGVDLLVHHAAAFAVPVVGLVLAAFRMAKREASEAQRIRGEIETAISKELDGIVERTAASIRDEIKAQFTALADRIKSGMDLKIQEVEASLEGVIRRKTDTEANAADVEVRLADLLATADTHLSALRATLNRE